MATATAPITGRLTLDELSQTVEFRQLTPKQALWVSTYVMNFLEHGTLDASFAVKTAYDTKSDDVTRITGCKLLANPKIILALNRFWGDSPEAAFLKLVEKALYSRKISVSRVRALELYSRLKGWTAGALADPVQAAETPEPARFNVGDIVLIENRKCRVREVNADGRPTDVEEVQ